MELGKLRVVVGVPDEESFGGHAYDLAYALIGVLRSLGPSVVTVTLQEWQDVAQRPSAIARIKDFAPHFSLAIPQTGYAFEFRDEAGTNLFSDILNIPLALPWDHLLTHAPMYFIRDKMYSEPQKRGARALIRAGLDKRLLMHYIPDSGHLKIYENLGLIDRGKASLYMPSADRHFLKAGELPPSAPRTDAIGFAGNVYVASGATLPLLQDPFMQSIDQAVRAAKNANWDISGWDHLAHIIDQLPQNFREANGLTPDFPLFWWMTLDLLAKRVSTSFRLHVLQSIEQPVDFYGNFVDPGSAEHDGENVRFFGSVPYAGLHELFRRYALWVDVTNAPFIYGCGAKIFNCFAAGSFMLTDFRQDVRDLIGDLAESFMYRNAEELREKIAYYRNNASRRQEIIEAMQAIIRARLTWANYYKRVCEDVITAFELEY